MERLAPEIFGGKNDSSKSGQMNSFWLDEFMNSIMAKFAPYKLRLFHQKLYMYHVTQNDDSTIQCTRRCLFIAPEDRQYRRKRNNVIYVNIADD
ncbi:hypothetical protein CEXT_774091 [Caerostris extrusa]|uniref:Uncharacterized protein n=1 Tax=Caerostris extrusa TaxID=172846 RepID=A0AAV4NK48_CAEEX|nr:hypothetical protein CEXT_774091 [Caerostris extrusa]